MSDAEIIKMRPSKEDVLNTFLDEIKEHSNAVRPMIFIGMAEDGHPVLHLMDMSWAELAHVKTAFEMHVTKDWLGML
jgi:hypothetical protein